MNLSNDMYMFDVYYIAVFVMGFCVYGAVELFAGTSIRKFLIRSAIAGLLVVGFRWAYLVIKSNKSRVIIHSNSITEQQQVKPPKP